MTDGRFPPILRPWLTLLALLVAALAVIGARGGFWREDLLLYDQLLFEATPAPDVLVVAIDDASLTELGRWPWPRALHARLLDRLRAAGVRAVALDVVLSESEAPASGDDRALAEAMRHGPPTVLPVIVDWQRADGRLVEIPPVSELAAAAAALAHVHLEIDRDGIARSVYLREGLNAPRRSHLALALLEAAGGPVPDPLPGERAPQGAAADGAWLRDYHLLIPFTARAGQFPHVSFTDVLDGRVDPAVLRGKRVLVGATAQGLGDAFPTPRSGEGISMPGVEISANVLSALETGQAIRPVSRGLGVGLGELPLVLAFLGFLVLSPRNALLWTLTLAALALLASVAALHALHAWWSPVGALAALALAYPLWSWRRLEATQGYLDEELARLRREPAPLPVAAAGEPRRWRLGDTLEARISGVREATARLRDLRRLLGEVIAVLPDAILLVDRDGRIVLANPGAAALLGAPDPKALEGRSIEALLEPVMDRREVDFRALAEAAPATRAVRDRSGRDLMVKVAEFRDDAGRRTGSVVDIADVSVLKRAERERDDTIRFLSHDLRAPSSSLLGLALVLRDPKRALPPATVASRIESLAQRTLTLADGFLALARAQVIAPTQFAPCDLADVVQDALDEVWMAAEAREVRLAWRAPVPAPVIPGDRHMLARALTNLIGNAVKYAPAGSAVEVSATVAHGRCRIRVRDEGPGIALESQHLLFRRFQRIERAAGTVPGGTGLGLAFVRIVAEKHGGSVGVESAAGLGATFLLDLPVEATTERAV